MSTRSPQPFQFLSTKTKERSHGPRPIRRNHRQGWKVAARHREHTERSFCSIPFRAVSFFGRNRCFGFCPALELASLRGVASHRASPAVRGDDVQVLETRDSYAKRRSRAGQPHEMNHDDELHDAWALGVADFNGGI